MTMSRRVVLPLCLAFVAPIHGCGPSLRPPLERAAPKETAAIARGEYLFRHVADCAGCHAMVDPQTGALDRELPVAGGAVYTKAHGAPGEVYVPNITSDVETGLGRWTDGEIVRALREGVDADDQALFSMMPYDACFRVLSDEDAFSIVAYMRTLPPVRNEVPARELVFPVGLVVKGLPEPLEGPVPPPPDDPISQGEYLVTVAGCAECHTPRNKRGQPLEGMRMAGGHHLRLLDLRPADAPLLMPNITPDVETGIGAWTDEQIRAAIQDGIRPDGSKLAPQGPAAIFHDMTPEDVTAIIAYLRTIPAVSNPAAIRSKGR